MRQDAYVQIRWAVACRAGLVGSSVVSLQHCSHALTVPVPGPPLHYSYALTPLSPPSSPLRRLQVHPAVLCRSSGLPPAAVAAVPLHAAGLRPGCYSHPGVTYHRDGRPGRGQPCTRVCLQSGTACGARRVLPAGPAAVHIQVGACVHACFCACDDVSVVACDDVSVVV